MTISTLLVVAAVTWPGVTKTNHLGGRPVSEGYLQGKVVLIDCRDYSTSLEEMKQLETMWQNYKMKPFVLLGAHHGAGSAAAAREAIEKAGVTYPVYYHAELGNTNFVAEAGSITIVDAAGKTFRKTRDIHRAFEGVVTAIGAALTPSTAKQYVRLIDYEFTVLPGKAWTHLNEFKQKFPNKMSMFTEEWKKLAGREEVERAAALEKIAVEVKDGTRRCTAAQIRAIIDQYVDLKQSNDPLIVQEAKNCLADLTWAAAARD